MDRQTYKTRRQKIGTRKFVAQLMGGEKAQKLANYEQGKQKIPPIAWEMLKRVEGQVIQVCKCGVECKLTRRREERAGEEEDSKLSSNYIVR